MATWKNETIDNYVSNGKQWLRHYMEMPLPQLRDIGIRLSDGDKKMGTVLNYSLLPVITCPNCDHCKNACFGLIPCIRWPDGAPIRNRAINTALAILDLETFLQQLEDHLRPLPAGEPFRPHQDGEFFSYKYFAGINEVIGNVPHVQAWTYTTMDRYTEQYYQEHNRPANFAPLLSTWPGAWEPKNSHKLPQFFTLDIDGGQEWYKGIYKCPGNCQICLKTGRGCPYGETVQNMKRTAANSRRKAHK